MKEVVATAAITKILQNLERIYKEVSEEWKAQTGEKINNYLTTFLQKNSEVKTILHGNQPKPFYDVYFPLRLSCKDRIVPDKNVENIFKIRNTLIVSAEAGSGKSMLAKHLFIDVIERCYGIPFIIELRYLNETETKLEDYIFEQVSKHVTSSERVYKRLLDRGEFIFFLDGYDEVKKELKQKTIMGIKNINELYPNIKLFISSRPYTNIDMLQNFQTLEICPLDEEEIVGFIKKQIDDEQLASQMCSSVNVARKSKISSFLQNPLLLTLYILTYQNSSEIPGQASLFYRRVINALFIEHDSKTKFGYQRERVSKVSYDRFEDVMKKFSIVSFFDDKISFDYEYARKLIGQIIDNDENCNFTSEELIEDLKLAFSLWVEDSGFYSFAHRSIQEYFAALYIRDLDEESKQSLYSQIVEKMDKFTTDMYNLLSILNEIDNIAYLKYYLVPVISEYHSFLTDNPDNTSFLFSMFSFHDYKKESVIRTSISLAGFKYYFLLDKERFTGQIFKIIDEEVIKKNGFGDLVKNSHRKKHYLSATNVSEKGKKYLNELDTLFSVRNEVVAYLDNLKKTSNEAIRFAEKKKSQILNLIKPV